MDNHYKHIIFMKAGPYCGFSLETIIDIKEREEQAVGKFFWGYSGVFCHPKRVVPFVEMALQNGSRPTLLFAITPSKFSSSIGQAKELSINGKEWTSLPKQVLLVGNKYAVVGQNLRRVNLELDLSEYEAMLGQELGKPLDEYIKYRVDKACAVHVGDKNRSPKTALISFASELVEPFCVYVR